MQRIVAVAVVIGLLLMTACTKHEVPVENDMTDLSEGRYQGIGTLPTSEMWEQLDLNEQGMDNASARLADDSQRIIVVDSKTGEVRQCGDMSGHCISMDPWTSAPDAKQAAPVKLKKHVADLRAEEEARRKADERKSRKNLR